MTGHSTQSTPLPSRRKRRTVWGGAAVLVLTMLAIALLLLANNPSRRAVPQFPSLRSSPDLSLVGTVAYFTTNSCIDVVSASGEFSKQVLCLTAADTQKPQQAGLKLIGPQLIWRPDGRLEITMFAMTKGDGKEPSYSAGWQEVVDVRTGAIERTPTTHVPNTWNTSTRPTNGPSGQHLTVENASDGSGKVAIILTQPGRPDRALLSTQGPSEYTYHLYSAFWSPDRKWIAADDGRILVLTLGNPVVVRVLADNLASGGFNDDPARANFAITTANLLSN